MAKFAACREVNPDAMDGLYKVECPSSRWDLAPTTKILKSGEDQQLFWGVAIEFSNRFNDWSTIFGYSMAGTW